MVLFLRNGKTFFFKECRAEIDEIRGQMFVYIKKPRQQSTYVAMFHLDAVAGVIGDDADYYDTFAHDVVKANLGD